MNTKTMIAVLALLVVVGGAYFLVSAKGGGDEPVFCTMEAKQCPDGSYVGREGPNCEFAPCPDESESKSGIKGIVLLGPRCPVLREDDPSCDDAPYQTSLVLTNLDGSKILKTFTSDKDGTFSVQISPGEYMIYDNNTSVLPECATRGTVRVRENTYTETTVYCDSGIR